MNNSLQVHEETASSYFNQGNIFKQSDQLQEAAAAYLRCTELNPDFSWYHHNLGEVLAKLGHWEAAEKSYRRACELNQNYAWSWHNLGEVLEQQGNLDGAVTAYRIAVELYPDFYDFYNSLGKALCLQGQLDESISCLRKAIALDSKSAFPYQNLWEPLARQGRVDEGIECLQRAIELNPGEAELYLKLAEALQGKNELAEAVGYYQKTIQLQPDFYLPYYKLGTALSAQGKWEEAIASYSQAAELEPGSAIVHHYLGHTWSSVQRWDEAIECYRKAIELFPDSPIVYQHLGDALAAQQKWKQAVSSYRKSVKMESKSLEAQDHLGFALYQLGRFDEAIAAYGKALEISPNADVVIHHLGDALTSIKNWDEAVVMYHRALAINSQSVEIYPKLGAALVSLKKWDEAVITYRRAIEHNPQSDVFYQQLGDAVAKENHYEGAIAFYKLALHIKIDNTDDHWLALGQVMATRELTKGRLSLDVLSPLTIKERINNNATSSTLVNEPKSLATDVRLIAYYLPQFHPIPENDLWWGKGFTEWTNVAQAQPLFEGHYQPHLPADLGFYDLRLPEVREAQATLAKKYGIYGFCYYYYWFAGKRLLHHPIDEVLRTKKPDFPFCICWANENWTRRWDGAEHEILIAQEHSLENNQAFAESIVHILLDERYIRINGAPLLVIYRSDLLPNPLRTTEEWRKVFRRRGVGEVHLSLAGTFGNHVVDPATLGFDSGVQFPPHAIPTREVAPPLTTVPDFSGRFYDYKYTAINATSHNLPPYKLFPAVMTSWDNTARRKKTSHAFLDSNPDAYEIWLRGAIEKVKQRYSGDEKLVFINAWNEWAEGAHLEPDQKYGHGYLSATYKALHDTHNWRTTLELLRHLPGKSIDCIHQLLDELERRMSGKNRSLETMCQSLQESVVVSEVSDCHNESDLWWHLESPSRDTFNDDDLTIKGWVVAKKSPAVAVEVMCQGRLLSQTSVDIERADVATVHPVPGAQLSGFSLNLQAVQLSSEVDLKLRTLLKDETYLPLAELRLESALNILQKQGMLLELKVGANSLVDVVQTIINLLRIVYDENMNVSEGGLLDELEKKIEAKEQLIEDMAKVIKQRRTDNPCI
ncbi:MAG: glycoside hydrolase family 99-like domain-containing protein [Microcoleus sp. PH2017_40_RAT_O_B]|uniref:glycoside hydrolase family 99-like domain-containing protein n=1 Tax=unclassified Microcoleus TaxID=2642155 RepID=UPI001DE18125|nr:MULTISPECIES: glycoside hydrolase family 99-like domain-containing protein [unclassified Microcoleus]MCC3571024.1 glycoside hydrolase family 99-like domain-containing protein [Microcoleus sp. PH2017_34_RAT_O_A]MCC3608597.1 glycoside hydrolase family 99-like domain-containing protein [Microcoleus sp. PH2017_40_RAT_O_B]